MLLFGHFGVTLGIIFFVCLIIPRLKNIIDLKFLLVGALLPDLIDKPIGMIIFASTISSGRMIGHTFLFSSILLYIGLYAYEKRGDTRIVSIAAGSFFHLMEDQIWAEPKTLFWPLLGINFPTNSIDNANLGIEQLIKMFIDSFSLNVSPASIPEIFGMGVVILFILQALLSKFKVGEGKQTRESYEKTDTLLVALNVLGLIVCGYIFLMLYYLLSGDQHF